MCTIDNEIRTDSDLIGTLSCYGLAAVLCSTAWDALDNVSTDSSPGGWKKKSEMREGRMRIK